MTDPNIVGQLVAHGELELIPAALRQKPDAQPCHTETVDAQEDGE